MSRRSLIACLGLAYLGAACSGQSMSSDASLGEESLADSVAGTGAVMPIPVKDGDATAASQWRGTSAELLLADAFTSCRKSTVGDTALRSQDHDSAPPSASDPDGNATFGIGDSQLEAVQHQTRITRALISPATEWGVLRNTAKYNVKPLSKLHVSLGQVAAYPAEFDDAQLKNIGSVNPGTLGNPPVLEMIGTNLCLARSIWGQLQLGGAMLTSDAEQLAMFEMVRERAQLAMLGIVSAASSIALTTQQASSRAASDWDQSLAIWAGDWTSSKAGVGPGGEDASKTLARWADDLADAVRLHVDATRKVTEMMVRSAAAHDPLPSSSGSNTALAPDDFAAGGWRARAMALLYGGLPLANTPGFVPAAVTDTNADARVAWPGDGELPRATPGAWTARAIRLNGLARQYDVLSLALHPLPAPIPDPPPFPPVDSAMVHGAGETADARPISAPTPSSLGPRVAYQSRADIDVAASASWLYRDLEAAIRSNECTSIDPASGRCHAWSGPDVVAPGSDLSTYRTYARFGITLQDASELVAALVDILPSTVARQGFHLVGDTVLSTPANRPPQLKFAATTHFVPPSLPEIASVYGRMGRFYIAGSVAKQPFTQSFPDDYSYRTHSERISFGRVLDGARALGAIPALAAVRETLTFLANTPNASFKAFASPKVLSVLQSALGDGQVSVHPVQACDENQDCSNPAAAYHLTQHVSARATDGTARRDYLVRVRPSASETFWSGQLAEYTFYAVPDSTQILDALADADHAHAGFSRIGPLLGNASSSAVARALDGELEATLGVYEGHSVTFVAQRSVGGAITYRGLSGTVRPWSHTYGEPANPGAGLPAVKWRAPVEDFYFVDNGSMTDLASRVLARAPWDPSQPAYDGFGNLRGVPPSTSAETSTGKTLDDYLARTLQDALNAEGSATAMVSSALSLIQQNADGEVNVKAAQDRGAGQVKDDLVKFCGPIAQNIGSTNASDDISAAAACGVKTMTINALGSTAAELASACGNVGAPPTAPKVDWQSGIACAPPSADPTKPNAAAQVRCALDQIAASMAFQVQVAVPVACSQYASAPPTFAPAQGALQARLLQQWTALKAYRDALQLLQSAGKIALDKAQLADQGVTLAGLQLDAANQRYQEAFNQGMATLADLTNKVAEASQKYRDASTYADQLGALDASAAGKAGGAALAGAGTGAAVGSVIPGIGTAVGAVGGAIIGGLSSLFGGGPTDAQKEAARDAVNETQAAMNHAVDAEMNYARYLGVCVSGAPADGGVSAPGGGTFGPCPDKQTAGTILSVAHADQLIQLHQQLISATQDILAIDDGVGALRERLATIDQKASDLQGQSIALQSDALAADLEIQQARLEVKYAEQIQAGNYAVSQAFFVNSLWDAEGRLESARRTVAAARTATEFVYAANLSSITTDQPSVRAPAIWADQIYDFDLQPLRAVGLSSGAPAPNTLGATKLQDYRFNLTAFQQGYLTSKRMTATTHAAKTVFVHGPAATVARTDADGNVVLAPDPMALRWEFQCPATSACASQGGWCVADPTENVATVCNAATAALTPTAARIRFSLDAWGNSSDQPGSTAQVNLLNGRWQRLALVLYGDHIQKCPPAGTPSGQCTSFVNQVDYVLREQGPFIVTNADGSLQALSLLPIGITGQAYEHNTYIDPIALPLDVAPLSSIRRGEFLGYPLGGNYELELHPTTSNDMTKIENIEIAFDALFWQPLNQIKP